MENMALLLQTSLFVLLIFGAGFCTVFTFDIPRCFYLDFGICVTISLERATNSVNRILLFLCFKSTCYFSFFPHFGFEGVTVVLIAPVPGHCLHFTFNEAYALNILGNGLFILFIVSTSLTYDVYVNSYTHNTQSIVFIPIFVKYCQLY